MSQPRRLFLPNAYARPCEVHGLGLYMFRRSGLYLRRLKRRPLICRIWMVLVPSTTFHHPPSPAPVWDMFRSISWPENRDIRQSLESHPEKERTLGGIRPFFVWKQERFVSHDINFLKLCSLIVEAKTTTPGQSSPKLWVSVPFDEIIG